MARQRISSKDSAIEATKRVCDRTAGREKCDTIYNTYKYGHGDTDKYFADMDGLIKRGRRKTAAKPKKKRRVTNDE